jgi:hypothetical protein
MATTFNPHFDLTIEDEDYSDRTLNLDATRFVRCTFDRCTFVYAGGGLYEFIDCAPPAGTRIHLAAPAKLVYSVLLKLHADGLLDLAGGIDDAIAKNGGTAD